MPVGGNAGGGLISTGLPGLVIDAPPFARYASLTAMAEALRAENWDVTGSLDGPPAVRLASIYPDVQAEVEAAPDGDH